MLIQTKEDPPAVKSTSKIGTPQYSYDAKTNAVASASETVTQQQADEADFLRAHAADSAKHAAAADEQ